MKDNFKKYKNLDVKTKALAGLLGSGLLLGATIPLLYNINKMKIYTKEELQRKSIDVLKSIEKRIMSKYDTCYNDIAILEKKLKQKYNIDLLDKKLYESYNIFGKIGKKLDDVLRKFYKNKRSQIGGSTPFNEKDIIISNILYNQEELSECYKFYKNTETRIKNQQKEFLDKIKKIEEANIKKLINVQRFS